MDKELLDLTEEKGAFHEEVEEKEDLEETQEHIAFKEKSEALIKKAIVAIENVGKVSNSHKYHYSDSEVFQMFSALEETISDTKHMFKKKKEFSW